MFTFSCDSQVPAPVVVGLVGLKLDDEEPVPPKTLGNKPLLCASIGEQEHKGLCRFGTSGSETSVRASHEF